MAMPCIRLFLSKYSQSKTLDLHKVQAARLRVRATAVRHSRRTSGEAFDIDAADVEDFF